MLKRIKLAWHTAAARTHEASSEYHRELGSLFEARNALRRSVVSWEKAVELRYALGLPALPETPALFESSEPSSIFEDMATDPEYADILPELIEIDNRSANHG